MIMFYALSHFFHIFHIMTYVQIFMTYFIKCFVLFPGLHISTHRADPFLDAILFYDVGSEVFYLSSMQH